MSKSLLPSNPEIQAAAKAAGIDLPYYGVEVVGDSFRFHLYGGRTVTVRALPGFGATVPTPVGDSRIDAPPQAGAEAERARPQRPKPAVKISGSLEEMTKAQLIELAREMGINPRSKATKFELIQQIQQFA